MPARTVTWLRGLLITALSGLGVANASCQTNIDTWSWATTFSRVVTRPAPIGNLEWKQARSDGDSLEYQISFPTADPSGYPENDTVPLTLMIPAHSDGKRLPVVLELHYLGAQDLGVERTLARDLNRQGIAAAFLVLPYHLSRAPEGTRSGELAVQPDVPSIIGMVVQSLADVRRSIDLLVQRPEIDPNQIGVAGISLGSLIAEVAFGVEPRFNRAAFMLGGVDIAHILWTSSRVIVSRGDLRRRGYTETRLRSELSAIEPSFYLKRRFEDPTQKTDSFVIAGRYDTVIPRSSTDRLIDALPDPSVLWIDTGHYGGVFIQRKLLGEVATYFGQEDTGHGYIPPREVKAPTLRLVAQAVAPRGFDIGVGLDLFQTHEALTTFGSFVITPRGPEVFIGKLLGNGIALGGVLGIHGPGAGVFWSTVL